MFPQRLFGGGETSADTGKVAEEKFLTGKNTPAVGSGRDAPSSLAIHASETVPNYFGKTQLDFYNILK